MAAGGASDWLQDIADTEQTLANFVNVLRGILEGSIDDVCQHPEIASIAAAKETAGSKIKTLMKKYEKAWNSPEQQKKGGLYARPSSELAQHLRLALDAALIKDAKQIVDDVAGLISERFGEESPVFAEGLRWLAAEAPKIATATTCGVLQDPVALNATASKIVDGKDPAVIAACVNYKGSDLKSAMMSLCADGRFLSFAQWLGKVDEQREKLRQLQERLNSVAEGGNKEIELSLGEGETIKVIVGLPPMEQPFVKDLQAKLAEAEAALQKAMTPPPEPTPDPALAKQVEDLSAKLSAAQSENTI